MSRVNHKYLVIRRVLTEKVPFLVQDKFFGNYFWVKNYSKTHYMFVNLFSPYGNFMDKKINYEKVE